MRLKIILVLLFFLFSLFFFFSEDATTDIKQKYDKAFEFSTGGGFNHSFVLTIYNAVYSLSSKPSEKYNYTFISPYEHSIAFVVPTSVVFHPVKFFGIGGIYILGFDLSLFYGFFPSFISVQNKFRIINKIGNFNDKKRWFLLEYGIALSNKIPISFYRRYNLICFGPSIFIGYEKIFDKPFAFSIGFSYDGLYYYKKNEFYLNIEEHYWFLYFGIEARFRFVFFKELKNN
jgi:hypothetical protein